MVPLDKVKNIISRHDVLEKELSSGNIEASLFAKKSKEYSSLNNIIKTAVKSTSWGLQASHLPIKIQSKRQAFSKSPS